MIHVSRKIHMRHWPSSYLGDLGRGRGFGKLTPPKGTEVLRSLTRELTSAAFDGDSLRRRTWAGGITTSMSNSGRYMVRGRGEASLSLVFREFSPSSVHRCMR